MSREALSLEISQVVSRVVNGEAIDAKAQGAMLAQRYPELGMSGEMIGEAIMRAASMVGMIKSTPMPAARSAGEAHRHAAPAARMNGDPARTQAAGLARSDDGDLASAVDTKVGSLASGEAARSSGIANGQPSHEPVRAAATKTRRSGPLAALRRAFLRVLTGARPVA